jgi:hypothetical protein
MILLLTIALELLVISKRKSRKDNEFKEENEDTHLFI